MLWTQKAQLSESTTNFYHCTCDDAYLLLIRVQTTLNHTRFVFYHNIKDNERNLCQDLLTIDNWKHRLGLESADAALCKWATCTHQTFLSKTFANLFNMQKQKEKNVWEKSNDVYSLSIRVWTTLNHILICFLRQYQHQRKCFFQSMSWKRHCATHLPKQRVKDSYWQWQISRSDREISSNCGKNLFSLGGLFSHYRLHDIL